MADHLVVFENDIIVFSDKDIAWQAGKPINVAWSRWHREAVLSGARQLWGAERWIRSFPERLFIDRACTVRYPVPLPQLESARVHLVLVAHGAGQACRTAFGGSGSLVLSPRLGASSTVPFTIGDLDSSRSFVHVLDDTTLDVVMKHCDTVADFVAYLSRKERFVRSGRLIAAAGEEELLAEYLKKTDAHGMHDFVFDPSVTGIAFDEGSYEDYLRHPQARAKAAADELSYAWDDLIERFAGNVIRGTLYHSSGDGIAHHEPGLRLMAREPRVRRRMLMKSFLEIATSPLGDPRRRVRILAPTAKGDPYYVLMLLERPADMSQEDYRVVRRNLLFDYARTVCLIDPSAGQVLGLAMDTPSPEPSSEDLLLIDGRELTADQRKEAAERRVALNLLRDVRERRSVESEYPKPFTSGTTTFSPSLHRNAPCPCGSGKKYRLCCRVPNPFRQSRP